MQENIKGICKECKFGCGRLENPLFTGVDKCEYCSKEQIQIEQLRIGGTNDI